MLIVLDFESEGIEDRPNYPPNPVGLAVMKDDPKDNGIYHAWGHPQGNNCDIMLPTQFLLESFSNEDNWFVFHNAAFDCSIIEEKMHLKVPWSRVHDTMLMAFLYDPYGELSLKPLADRHLGEPPIERDVVRDWLISHGICHANAKDWGAHISKAPAQIVGPYAVGDVRRTLKLYKFLLPKLKARGQM